jgi:large subunit ribosomal protein L9
VKVVFIEDVPNVAELGEVREVADGYGRNYLLPRKLAVLADSQASHLVEARLKVKAKREAKTQAEMNEFAKKLEGKKITLKARVGAKDRLYGSITSGDIADELDKSAGLVVDRRKIELAEPIRQLGSYDVEIKLYKGIAAGIKVVVIAEEEEKEAEKQEETGLKKEKAGKKKEGKAEKGKVKTEKVEEGAEEKAKAEEQKEEKKQKKEKTEKKKKEKAGKAEEEKTGKEEKG